MALSILTLPDSLEPVYSPFWFRLASTLSTNQNFRYVFDINTISQITGLDNPRVARVKLFPRPTGEVQISPSSILENYLSYDYDFFGSGFTACPNSIVKYHLRAGEEYSISGLTFSSVTNNGGFVQYNFNSVHGLLANDIIRIDKTLKTVNDSYDGEQTVYSAVSTTQIRTDKVYGTITTSESGDCIYRLSFSSGLTQSGTCINFARQYNQPNTNFAQLHYLKDINSNFLLDFYDNIPVADDDVYTLSFIESAHTATGLAVATYDAAGLTVGIYVIPKPASVYDRFDVKAGPANLSQTILQNLLSSAYETVFNSNVKQYKVEVLSGSTPISELITFDVSNPCGFNEIRLAYLNRRGGWSYQNFNMKSRRKIGIEREFIEKTLPWNYSEGNRGTTTIAIRTDEAIQLTTDWLNTENLGYQLEGLFTSPEVYWLIPDSSTVLPLVVISKEFVTKTFENDKMISYTIEVKYAFSSNLQRN